MQNEYLESKLEEYENVLSEMEKLQNKLEAYERKILTSEYMEMNKKENEIIILRSENSNLKNCIASTEKNFENLQIKFSEYKNEKDKVLAKQNDVIQRLTRQLMKYEEGSLLDNIQNSLSDQSDNIVSQVSQSKIKNNYIISQTSRINNNENNLLNLFNSEGKEKSSERKLSINELFLLDNIKKNDLINREIISNFVSNELSSEKLSEISTNDKKEKQRDSSRFRAYSHIFEKINNSSKLQKYDSNKKMESSEKNVKIFSA